MALPVTSNLDHRGPSSRGGDVVIREAVTDAGNVSPFPAKKSKRRRKRKSLEESFRVDHVKPSKGTWAFRIRWTEENVERPAVYVSRVSDELFAAPTSSRKTYGNFKKHPIAAICRAPFGAVTELFQVPAQAIFATRGRKAEQAGPE